MCLGQCVMCRNKVNCVGTRPGAWELGQVAWELGHGAWELGCDLMV